MILARDSLGDGCPVRAIARESALYLARWATKRLPLRTDDAASGVDAMTVLAMAGELSGYALAWSPKAAYCTYSLREALGALPERCAARQFCLLQLGLLASMK